MSRKSDTVTSSICTKCSRVFKLSESIALVLGAVIGLTLLLSVVMFFVLRSRRTPDMRSWHELPLHKKIFHRLLFMVRLGNLPILVTFIQMLLEFTEWDAYAQVGILNLVKGDAEGIGLRCFFPFLADPMASLLLQLGLPYFMLAIFAASIGIASLVMRIQESRELAASVEDSSESASGPLLGVYQVPVKKFDYPALALFTSVSISVIKFFYFGTALAAHQYIFSDIQASSGIKYVQNHPWMTFASAKSLIAASIPSILVFDLILPVAFIYTSWRFRNTFNSYTVSQYVGTIFETFNVKCYWWEIVNTLRKLAVAFVMQALPSSDALQSALVCSIIAGTLMLQVTLNPWRRKTENFSDSLSSVLLVAALLATRPGEVTHMTQVRYCILALSFAFITLSVGFLVYHTVMSPADYELRMAQQRLNLEMYGKPIPTTDTMVEGFLSGDDGLSTGDFASESESDLVIDPSSSTSLNSM